MTDIDLSDLAADRGGSQPLRGYLASPPGTGPWPAVVMIHEIFGLDDLMRGHDRGSWRSSWRPGIVRRYPR